MYVCINANIIEVYESVESLLCLDHGVLLSHYHAWIMMPTMLSHLSARLLHTASEWYWIVHLEISEH